jgi:hypothetical protein
MALVRVLAREWKMEVEDELAAFVEVGGINTFAFGGSKTDADTTGFDSEGWAEHLVAERSRTLTMEGFYIEDKDTGARDPGQEIVDGLAEKIGEEAIGNFKLTSPGGTVLTFSGSVEPADIGGGHNDATSWGATITINGKVTKS